MQSVEARIKTTSAMKSISNLFSSIVRCEFGILFDKVMEFFEGLALP